MIRLIRGDSFASDIPASEMIFTDPPFETDGRKLAELFARIDYRHLVLICSQHQALDFYKHSENITFGFDMIVSHVSPKKSRSYHQPNMLHSNILYFRHNGVGSAFDRRRVERQDVFGADGYYPSIFHAPKTGLNYRYQKNQQMLNALLGAFDVGFVCDPFAGSGSTALAMLENGISDGIMIEKNADAFALMRKQLALFAAVE